MAVGSGRSLEEFEAIDRVERVVRVKPSQRPSRLLDAAAAACILGRGADGRVHLRGARPGREPPAPILAGIAVGVPAITITGAGADPYKLTNWQAFILGVTQGLTEFLP